MPTMPTDAYRCPLEICAGAQSFFFGGGLHGMRGPGPSWQLLIKIASGPVKARAHVS